MPATDQQSIWRLMPPTPRAAGELAQELAITPWAAQVLCHRGLASADQARAFLDPSLEDLPLPGGLLGLSPALKVLVPALTSGQVIGVAGDYDADGVTACALLVEFLQRAGARVVWELPHRVEDGYGFSPPVAERLAAAGAQVAVTVDCGVSDHQGVARARELGMAVVVTDHHQMPPGPLVGAEAVINPRQDACPFPPELAGAGVAFYLAAGLRAALRRRGWFDDRPEPNLMQSLDLVALGTLADVSPLTGANRVLVRQGLAVMGQGNRPGLAALMGRAGASAPLSERDVCFSLAPRINAPGRLDSAAVALELLLAASPGPAARLAAELEEANQRRRELEQQVLAQAQELAGEDAGGRPFLLLAREGWHRGVLGIVASRLMDAWGRPVLLLSLDNGNAVGSGRSLPGFHLQRALAGCADILSHYGGHELAAGVSLPSAKVGELGARLESAAAQALPPPGAPPELVAEAEAAPSDLGPAALASLERLAPFGNGHPEPLLLARGLEVAGSRVVGNGHLKLELAGQGRRLSAIGFGMAHLAHLARGPVDAMFHPRVSTYGGRHLELGLADLRPAEAAPKA